MAQALFCRPWRNRQHPSQDVTKRFYRLWCGRKRYTPWLADEQELWRIAIRNGLAYEDRDGNAGLGPLTWIEVGERKYTRSRTVTTARRGYPYG